MNLGMSLQKKKTKTSGQKSFDSNPNLWPNRSHSRNGRKRAQTLLEQEPNNDADQERVVELGDGPKLIKKGKIKKGNILSVSHKISDDRKVMNGENCEVELLKDNKQPLGDEALEEDGKKGRRESRHKGSEEIAASGSHTVDDGRFYSEGNGINEGVKEPSKYGKKLKKEKEKGKQKQTPSQISLIAGGTHVQDEDRKKKRKKKVVNNASNNSTQCAVNYNWENDKEPYNNKKRKGCLESEEVEDSSKQKVKKVSFSNEAEEFLPGHSGCEGMVPETYMWGKRFTADEDTLLRNAIMKYVEDHQLGDQGMHMVLHSKDYRQQLGGCWKVIASSLRWRPLSSVYNRARTLCFRSEERKWQVEELEFLKRFCAEHGGKWKKFGDIVGRYGLHVKDAWQRIKLPGQKTGRWSQDEYQTLFDLVNLDLRFRAFEKKKENHSVIRDNISWDAISSKLATRRAAICCKKWYYQLVSPMVKDGQWTNLDDYKMIIVLQQADPCCIEDVDWDSLLEHRSGELCRKRWYELIRHLHNFWMMPFVEQLEMLSRRYYPEMVEHLQHEESNEPDS